VDEIRQAMGDGRRWDVSLEYVVETEPLGTAGGVRNAADLVSGLVVVLNGDILTDADVSGMLRFHSERGSRATIFLTRVEDTSPYGLVELAGDGRVKRFVEKPGPADRTTTDTINAGIYVLDAALLDRIPAGRVASMEREVLSRLLADAVPCFGWVGDCYWIDIGSPAKYRQAHLDLLAGRVRTDLGLGGASGDRRSIAADAVLGARVQTWRPWWSARPAGSVMMPAWAPRPSSVQAARWERERWWKAPSSGTACRSGPEPCSATASWARAFASPRAPARPRHRPRGRRRRRLTRRLPSDASQLPA
jgi:hypothetical protein